jgi:hypothetical protein
MQLQELASPLSYDEELVVEIEARRRRKTFSSSWHQIMLDLILQLARCNSILLEEVAGTLVP